MPTSSGTIATRVSPSLVSLATAIFTRCNLGHVPRGQSSHVSVSDGDNRHRFSPLNSYGDPDATHTRQASVLALTGTAVFIASSMGGAVAARMIGSDDIINNSIQQEDLQADSVGNSELKADARRLATT